jgi:hypothetical protein
MFVRHIIGLEFRGELALSDTSTHGSSRRDTTGDGLDKVVSVVGTAPL